MKTFKDEAAMRIYFKDQLAKTFDPKDYQYKRIEQVFSGGTPDAYLCLAPWAVGLKQIAPVHGWIESKHVEEYPKRESTKIKVGLTELQNDWIQKHIRLSGHAIVMVCIKSDWFIFADSFSIVNLLEGLTKADLFLQSDLYFSDLTPKAIKDIVQLLYWKPNAD